MTYEISCSNLGMDCSYTATARSMGALMSKVTEHGKAVHGYTEKELKDPGMVKKLKSVIKRK
ncbi:DUF1059 domain-containing protein [Candidatus Woesearchaeota archaeon]|nr:DUF1059 domain-containing protein [Candidatus Woesearchaeota archaeon]